MADALISIATEKIKGAAVQRAELFLGAADEFQKLCFTFQSIQAVLDDAETRQVTEESVRLWLWRLKQVAYDIDDLVDEEMVSSLLDKDDELDDVSNRHNKVRTLIFKLREWLLAVCSRYELAGRVKEMREKLDQIADDKNKYGFSSIVAVGGSSAFSDGRDGSSRPPTTSLQELSKMIGRDKDTEILIRHLVSHEEGFGRQKVPVVAIQGVGGLGKTTLAQEIYNHGTVEANFDQKIWVCVTENYKIERITKAILEQLKKDGTMASELQTLQMEVVEALKNKRFFLVLDDVWNDDETKWNKLGMALRSGATGSRILVTTRSEKVAIAMCATYIHPLQGLSNNDCWEIFSSRAFFGRTEEERMELEEIRKEIVKKCDGVPLSVRVMGSAMKSKQTVKDWVNILNSPIWTLPEAENEIIRPLLLSYSNLPPHLKRCFAYCSVYPKDDVMEKDKLIKLWIAQDFIRSDGNNRDIDDIGEEYFNQLVASSMLQEVEVEVNQFVAPSMFQEKFEEEFEEEFEVKVEMGEPKTRCKMHDLLHDVAQFIMKDETGIFESGDSGECSVSFRHASLFLHNDSSNDDAKPCKVPSVFSKLKKLRTLFLNGSARTEIDASLVAKMFDVVPFLRALHVNKIEVLPETIGELKHLRYLDLSNSNIEELPDSVTHLPMLCTLNLNGCVRLKRLANGMGRMVRLTHLEIQDTDLLECLPRGLGRIHSLRSLYKFIVGGEGGCGIDELEKLNSLQRILCIDHLERVSSKDEARKARLQNKSGLRILKLMYKDRVDNIEKASDVLEVLKPPRSLEKLMMEPIPKLPSWLDDHLSLPKLTKLEITGHDNIKNLPGLGKLPALKSLDIRHMGVRKLDHEFYFGSSSGYDGIAFPKLEKLSLEVMLDLNMWGLQPSATEIREMILMPSLHVLKLGSCLELEVLPHHLVSTLKDLEIEGCRKLKGSGCCFPLLERFSLKAGGESFTRGLPNLPNLKKLHIGRIYDKRLPDEGWKEMESLEQLTIQSWILESLPDRLGQLKALKSLKLLSLRKLYLLPDGLGQLQSLERLIIDNCSRLESLPDELGQLKALKTLNIHRLESLTSLPAGMAQLQALQSLVVIDCKALVSLPPGLPDLPLLQKAEFHFCPLLASHNLSADYVFHPDFCAIRTKAAWDY